MITSGEESFAIFTYQCGAMAWHGNATIGFNAGGTWFENHPLSRTVNANSIACINDNYTVWTNLVYKLTPRGTTTSCKKDIIQRLYYLHIIIEIPYLMFSRYSNLIQRVTIHGNQLTNIHEEGVPRGLDFDYRY